MAVRACSPCPVCRDRMHVLLVTHAGGEGQKRITPEPFPSPLTCCRGAKTAPCSPPSSSHPPSQLHESGALRLDLFNNAPQLPKTLPGMCQAREKNFLNLTHSGPLSALRPPYIILSHPPHQSYTKVLGWACPCLSFCSHK